MEEKLATELLHELKTSAKRWFIAFLAVLGLLFGTIVGFLVYLSLPVEETYTADIEQNADGSGENHIVGGDYNGIPENDDF